VNKRFNKEERRGFYGVEKEIKDRVTRCTQWYGKVGVGVTMLRLGEGLRQNGKNAGREKEGGRVG